MSQTAMNSLDDKGEDMYATKDYFIGLAQRIVASGKNTRVSLSGAGEVSLFPGRKAYSASIVNEEAFFQTTQDKFHTEPLDDASGPEADVQQLSDLLWQAAFHASKGRLAEGTSKFDVVQFKKWPNLPKLAQTPNTARICALLTRHPTTIMLAHRQLGISREEVYHVYGAAYGAGIARIVNQNKEATSQQEAEVAPPAEERGLFRSLFSKISGL